MPQTEVNEVSVLALTAVKTLLRQIGDETNRAGTTQTSHDANHCAKALVAAQALQALMSCEPITRLVNKALRTTE